MTILLSARFTSATYTLPPRYICTSAHLNATVQLESNDCLKSPQLQANWRDVDGSPSLLSVCMSVLQSSHTPVPAFGASWALNLGSGVHLGHEDVSVDCV